MTSPKRVKISSSDEINSIIDLLPYESDDESEEESTPKHVNFISLEERKNTFFLVLKDELLNRMQPIPSEENKLTLDHPLEQNKRTLDGTSSHESDVLPAICPTNLVQPAFFHGVHSSYENSSEYSALSVAPTTPNVSELAKNLISMLEKASDAHESGGRKRKKTADSNPESQKQIDIIGLCSFTKNILAPAKLTEDYDPCLRQKLMDVSNVVACNPQIQTSSATICPKGISSQLSRHISKKRNDIQARIRNFFLPSESIPSAKVSDLNPQNSCFFPDIQHGDSSPELQQIDWLQVIQELQRSGVDETTQSIRLATLQSKAWDRLKLRRLALNWNIDINLF